MLPLQSPMIVQHQLEVYIENPCQFLCQLSKKSGARDRVQPPLPSALSSNFIWS